MPPPGKPPAPPAAGPPEVVAVLAEPPPLPPLPLVVPPKPPPIPPAPLPPTGLPLPTELPLEPALAAGASAIELFVLPVAVLFELFALAGGLGAPVLPLQAQIPNNATVPMDTIRMTDGRARTVPTAKFANPANIAVLALCQLVSHDLNALDRRSLPPTDRGLPMKRADRSTCTNPQFTHKCMEHEEERRRSCEHGSDDRAPESLPCVACSGKQSGRRPIFAARPQLPPVQDKSL